MIVNFGSISKRIGEPEGTLGRITRWLTRASPAYVIAAIQKGFGSLLS